MRVLVACEFSGTVRDAFLALGHDAMSCDLLGERPSGPIRRIGDVREILGADRNARSSPPPCTFLTNSGVRWLYDHIRYPNRRRDGPSPTRVGQQGPLAAPICDLPRYCSGDGCPVVRVRPTGGRRMTAPTHEHVCQKPSGRTCIEGGCTEPAGTLWGPLWCPDHDRERLNCVSAQMESLFTPGNLWLDLYEGGVQQVPLDRWIICYDGVPTTILTRAEVQATYFPADWDEAYNALGFQRWLGDPESPRMVYAGGARGPQS